MSPTTRVVWCAYFIAGPTQAQMTTHTPEEISKLEEATGFCDLTSKSMNCQPTRVFSIDDESIRVKPLIFRDPINANYYYVESDGRYVSAFTSNGKLLWRRNPFVEARIEQKHDIRPIIYSIGCTMNQCQQILIVFTSKDAGRLDKQTGDFVWDGKD